MRLENLSIAREDYGPNKGKYRCAVSFAGEFTKQSLILPSDVSNAILEAVPAHVIIAGEDLARNIRPAVEAAITPQLEAPADAD